MCVGHRQHGPAKAQSRSGPLRSCLLPLPLVTAAALLRGRRSPSPSSLPPSIPQAGGQAPPAPLRVRLTRARAWPARGSGASSSCLLLALKGPRQSGTNKRGRRARGAGAFLSLSVPRRPHSACVPRVCFGPSLDPGPHAKWVANSGSLGFATHAELQRECSKGRRRRPLPVQLCIMCVRVQRAARTRLARTRLEPPPTHTHATQPSTQPMLLPCHGSSGGGASRTWLVYLAGLHDVRELSAALLRHCSSDGLAALVGPARTCCGETGGFPCGCRVGGVGLAKAWVGSAWRSGCCVQPPAILHLRACIRDVSLQLWHKERVCVCRHALSTALLNWGPPATPPPINPPPRRARRRCGSWRGGRHSRHGPDSHAHAQGVVLWCTVHHGAGAARDCAEANPVCARDAAVQAGRPPARAAPRRSCASRSARSPCPPRSSDCKRFRPWSARCCPGRQQRAWQLLLLVLRPAVVVWQPAAAAASWRTCTPPPSTRCDPRGGGAGCAALRCAHAQCCGRGTLSK